MSCFFFQDNVVFIDCEGSPVQELSAIIMQWETKNIVSVYHHFAYDVYAPNDNWARKYLHGLNLEYLYNHGFGSTEQLIEHFKLWLSEFNYVHIFGNDPRKERSELNLDIVDIELPGWIDRSKEPYHTIANRFKELSVPISNSNLCCGNVAHSSYSTQPLWKPKNLTAVAKQEHGFHCSLYDCYEMYLFYLLR